MTYRDHILEYIRRNRVSTTEVADALGKTGVLAEVGPLTHDLFCAGPVRCVFTAHASNHAVHEQIRSVQAGEVVMVFTHDCDQRAVLGDLICKYLLLYRGASAVVVDGWVRDAAALRRNRYAVWARGATPLGCFNTPAKPFPATLERSLRERYDGGVAVCDDGGISVIPSHRLDADMLERLHRIELQEDVWFYCLDVLKWDTKTIVCDKRYLEHRAQLPTALEEHCAALEKPLDNPAGKAVA
jgi:regulator of RNase E activity RraA